MDIMIVCGPDPGGPDYAFGVAVGLLLVIVMWVRHRHLAARPAGRQILFLK